MSASDDTLTSIEICAGAGGQAIGLHAAGFRHLALVEIDAHAAATLERNIEERPGWQWENEHCDVHLMDVKQFNPVIHLKKYETAAGRKVKVDGEGEVELDLLAGGVPCPPFSHAGKQLGRDDERDLFPAMLDLVERLSPKAVMIENVRGILEPDHKFLYYRNHIKNRLRKAGYVICGWNVLQAQDYGVPQLRPRAILVAIREDQYRGFTWPEPQNSVTTVARALGPSMEARFGADVDGFKRWEEKASRGVAPTLVGGSKKHGGADLGPTRAKKAWQLLGVDGMGVANDPDRMVDKDRDLGNLTRGPKLTVGQAAIIQGFPEDWEFVGGKTARYRQVGNAFPPPVAAAVGEKIKEALLRTGPLAKNPSPEFEDEDDRSLFAPELPGLDSSLPASDNAEDGVGALVS
ncbi:DNA cytosine methyltransferase [Streptomyces sp. SYSU K21746]